MRVLQPKASLRFFSAKIFHKLGGYTKIYKILSLKYQALTHYALSCSLRQGSQVENSTVKEENVVLDSLNCYILTSLYSTAWRLSSQWKICLHSPLGCFFALFIYLPVILTSLMVV